MSDKKPDLALAFFQSHPDSAAALLEQQPIEHVAQFLLDVPYKQAGLVLKKMLPQYTARLFQYVDPSVCAGFLSEMDLSHIAAIMRHADDRVCAKVLELLPERTKIACNLLLSYPETAVGAWMSVNHLTLPDDCSVQEARTRLSSAEKIDGSNIVYITNRERHLLGAVSVYHLLKYPAHKLLTTIMEEYPSTLSGRASLTSVANDPLWDHSECVAIVNTNRQFIGVLRHLDLRKGLQEMSTTVVGQGGNYLITGILEAYGKCLLALMESAGEITRLRR